MITASRPTYGTAGTGVTDIFTVGASESPYLITRIIVHNGHSSANNVELFYYDSENTAAKSIYEKSVSANVHNVLDLAQFPGDGLMLTAGDKIQAQAVTGSTVTVIVFKQRTSDLGGLASA